MNYKKFEDYENYIIFKTGKIFSLIKNRFLNPSMDGRGYIGMSFYKKGRKKKGMTIHQLLGILFIPNPENKPTVDHINQNRSDNRLINLRWATRKEQVDNRSLNKNNTSGNKGISFYKGRKKEWHARIMVNGQYYNRGFESKEEAVAYRRDMEIKFYGEHYII